MSIRTAAVLALASILAAGDAARAQPGAAPGAGPGAAPGAGPGAAPGAGPGAAPDAGPGAAPGAGPGAAPGAGPDAGPGAAPGADRGADADADAAAAAPDLARNIARDVIRGIRRAIAIGPTFGVFSTYQPSGSVLDAGLSFGLELELFQAGIPTVEELQEIAKDKAKAKLLQVIRDRFAGQTPDAATRRQLLRELAEEIKQEVLATLRAKPRVLQRPRFAIPLEASYLFDSADWIGRLGISAGFGPVSLGPVFSVRFGDDTVARLGADLAIHLLPSPSPRSPVIDIFLRGEFELHARTTNDDQIVLGVRALLDLI